MTHTAILEVDMRAGKTVAVALQDEGWQRNHRRRAEMSRLASSVYSEDQVSEIRDRASIREVVSDYVTLKKAGKNYRGLCPFHSEKTPSFMVNEEKQIFHCFGCGTGGDVFTFLMKIGQFSFPQTIEELARRYAVDLPRRELSPGQKKEMAKRDLLFQINHIASDYFHDLLLRKREGEPGRKYLSQRGLTQEIIAEHRLGFAPDRWDGLVEHQRREVIDALERAGGNRAEAGQVLGIDRSTLWRRMRRLGVDR